MESVSKTKGLETLLEIVDIKINSGKMSSNELESYNKIREFLVKEIEATENK